MSEDETQATRSVDDASSVLPGFLARSFLAKFLLALLLVTVVIVGVSANTYAETNQQLTADTETEYIGVAQQSATQIQEWRQSRAETTRRLARFEVMQDGTQQQRQDFLQSESFRGDVYHVHFVNRETSTIRATTNPAKLDEPLNTREAPWQTEEIQYGDDGVFVSNATEALGRSLVSFVTEVETDSGEQFILVMQTDLDALAQDLPAPSEGVYSQVVDSQGRVVAGTQETSALARNDGTLQTYTENPNQLQMLQSGLSGSTGFLQGETVNGSVVAEPPEGVISDYVIAYAPIAGDDWVVATHVPISSAYELRNTITQSLLILTGTAFLGIGLIGIVFGRGAVGSLNRLTEKANRLEAGNLDVDLEVTRKDEFGQLTASFANMRDALRDRIQEAEAARKEAEVSRSEALAMTEYLEEKAEDYSEVMRQCANGDLTQRMEVDNENDAMDQIANEFNEMLGELEKTTGQLKTFSEEVAESSEIVLTNTENVRASAERVTQSVQTINTDATDQQERLEELAGDLDTVIDRLESLKGNPHVDINDELEQFKGVSDVLSEATGKSRSIRSEAESASETSKQQAEELDEVSERADRLKRYAKPLGGILDRFETAAEHEFVFSGGPSQPVEDDD
jgi:methyl-accepting chemotaxis protein